jgi:hypothetical protein
MFTESDTVRRGQRLAEMEALAEMWNGFNARTDTPDWRPTLDRRWTVAWDRHPEAPWVLISEDPQ